MSWSRTSWRSRPIQATLVAGGASRQWTGTPTLVDLVDEGVLPRQQVGDLRPDSGRDRGAGRTDQQPLGATPPEALGQHQDPTGGPLPSPFACMFPSFVAERMLGARGPGVPARSHSAPRSRPGRRSLRARSPCDGHVASTTPASACGTIGDCGARLVHDPARAGPPVPAAPRRRSIAGARPRGGVCCGGIVRHGDRRRRARLLRGRARLADDGHGPPLPTSRRRATRTRALCGRPGGRVRRSHGRGSGRRSRHLGTSVEAGRGRS